MLKFKILICAFVLLLFSVSGASAWTNTSGGDHGGANWTPDGDTIAGVHTGINIFTVSYGATATVDIGTELEIYANEIIITGTINGDSKGHLGGQGQGGAVNAPGEAGQGTGGGAGGASGGGGAAGNGGHAGYGQAGTGVGAGIEYGNYNTTSVQMGSGGGGGGGTTGSGASAGNGGNGGGSVTLHAPILNIYGIITMDGGAGTAGGTLHGNGGDGSGGGILLIGNDVFINGTLTATGDNGASGGRVKVFYYKSLDNSSETVIVTGGAAGTYYVVQSSNTAPTVPTITSPINASVQSYTPLSLQVNSTDAEGDSLTYYFYGDITTGDTYLGSSVNGTLSINITQSGYFYWKSRAADVNLSSANTSLQQFYFLEAPTLQSPTNASTQTLPYPPLLNEITFTWSDTGATGYKYEISEDADFNLIYLEDVITSNTTTQSMQIDTYYWRVAAYSTLIEDYSDWSNAWQFTINESNGGEAVTSIDGVVYEVTTAGSVAIDGALVNIWNTTWSDSMLVGQNGYYYFDGVKDGTYSVRATKTGYTDSSIELVTVLALNTTTRNILLQSTSGAGQQYVDHYVKFIVKSLTGTLYSDVEVNVYLGDAVIAQYTGTTGTDGSISFELDENQEYRITFVKDSPSIDKEITLYPKDDSYTVYVDIGTMIDDLLNPDDEEQAITAIDVSVTKTIINDNTANITVNYNDIMDETSGLTLTLSQSIAGNTTNKTILDTASLGTANNTAYNFTVTNYNGESYLIEIEATHTTHGAIYRMYGIQFENTDTLFGFTVEVVGWLAIIFLTWFALTATSITVQHTAIGVCALATAMIAIGWGSYISMSGLGLAWIMSLAANFAHAKEASA